MAGWSPMPAGRPSIHSLYAAVSVAPPAENCAQSRVPGNSDRTCYVWEIHAPPSPRIQTRKQEAIGQLSTNHHRKS